jgi:hypothetical protein
MHYADCAHVPSHPNMEHVPTITEQASRTVNIDLYQLLQFDHELDPTTTWIVPATSVGSPSIPRASLFQIYPVSFHRVVRTSETVFWYAALALPPSSPNGFVDAVLCLEENCTTAN